MRPWRASLPPKVDSVSSDLMQLRQWIVATLGPQRMRSGSGLCKALSGIDSSRVFMTIALATPPKASTRLFLGVERSVCGRPWRDRLDERATARALAMAQRHNIPELLARVLAGRGVEVDEVEAFPRSHGAAADARSARCHRHGAGGGRASPTPWCAAIRSRSSATTTSMARPPRRCWHVSLTPAASIRSCTSPTGYSRATARTSRRSARSPNAARSSSLPSTAAPAASSR